MRSSARSSWRESADPRRLGVYGFRVGNALGVEADQRVESLALGRRQCGGVKLREQFTQGVRVSNQATAFIIVLRIGGSPHAR